MNSEIRETLATTTLPTHAISSRYSLYRPHTIRYLGRYHPLALVFQIYNVYVILATDGPWTAQ